MEERLNIVESALAEFIIQTNRSLHRLEREMLVFKDEMKDFKDERVPGRKYICWLTGNGITWTSSTLKR